MSDYRWSIISGAVTGTVCLLISLAQPPAFARPSTPVPYAHAEAISIVHVNHDRPRAQRVEQTAPSLADIRRKYGSK